MTEDLSYLTPAKKIRYRFTVQGSRFIATLVPVLSGKAFQGILADITAEFPDATHHTFAYRIGIGSSLVERFSDDREPAGTAGRPILQALQGNNVSDAGLIGTRYFGGTRLGIGGLKRAYRDCARLCLEEAVLKKKEQVEAYQLQLCYEDLRKVTRLLESLEGEVNESFYSDKVLLKVSVPVRTGEKLQQGFNSACRGRGSWEKL